MEEDVKVCEACKSELQTENFYLRIQKPVLLRGENFKRYRMMGISSYIVKLRMINDDTMVYDGDGKPEPENIRLSTVSKIIMTNLTTFEIVTPAKAYAFEADSITTLKTWQEALSLAVRVAKEPPIRQRVEDDRRKKMDMRKRDRADRQQAKAALTTKQKRTEALTTIKGGTTSNK